MAGLEDSLGAKLFTRAQTGLLPTAAAHELLPHAEAMAQASEALQRAASGDERGTKGVVRLTASELIGVEVLPAILARFRENHPAIELELSLSNRQQDLLKREADIAVRMVRPKQTALVAKRIGRLQIHLFAHRDYIARHGTPKDINELTKHTIIGFDRDDSLTLDGLADLRVTRQLFAFRSDNDLAQLAALRAGLGIGGCQLPLAARDDALVPVLPHIVAFGLEMWLVMHEDMRATQRVRLLYDHLAAELSAYLKADVAREPGHAGHQDTTATKPPVKSRRKHHIGG
jgi:DNA-binding transcriptional LysR family regulator